MRGARTGVAGLLAVMAVAFIAAPGAGARGPKPLKLKGTVTLSKTTQKHGTFTFSFAMSLKKGKKPAGTLSYLCHTEGVITQTCNGKATVPGVASNLKTHVTFPCQPGAPPTCDQGSGEIFAKNGKTQDNLKIASVPAGIDKGKTIPVIITKVPKA